MHRVLEIFKVFCNFYETVRKERRARSSEQKRPIPFYNSRNCYWLQCNRMLDALLIEMLINNLMFKWLYVYIAQLNMHQCVNRICYYIWWYSKNEQYWCNFPHVEALNWRCLDHACCSDISFTLNISFEICCYIPHLLYRFYTFAQVTNI